MLNLEPLSKDRLRVYTIPEVAEILRISKGLAYQLAKEGTIPTIKLGAKRRVVTQAALERVLESESFTA